MLTLDSMDDMQNNLVLAFKTILSQGYVSSGGNHFDEVVSQVIIQSLKKSTGYMDTLSVKGPGRSFKEISPQEFAEKYKPFRALTTKKIFDFRSLSEEELASVPQSDLLVVRQPNGRQNWPDILVIANGVGLPVEVKSSKRDAIMWNGGIPEPDRLYVFNCKAGQIPGVSTGTTIFMGSELITQEEVTALRAHHETQRKQTQAFHKRRQEILKKQYGDDISLWPQQTTYYNRAMYVSNASYFKDAVLRQRRESTALDFITNYYQQFLSKPPPSVRRRSKP